MCHSEKLTGPRNRARAPHVSIRSRIPTLGALRLLLSAKECACVDDWQLVFAGDAVCRPADYGHRQRAATTFLFLMLRHLNVDIMQGLWGTWRERTGGDNQCYTIDE